MSLFACTECGKTISDKAKACPDCGCPVKRPQQNLILDNRKIDTGSTVAVLVLISLSLLSYFIIIKDLFDDRFSKAFPQVLELPYTWPLLILYFTIIIMVSIDKIYWYIPYIFYLAYKGFITKNIIASKLILSTNRPWNYDNSQYANSLFEKVTIYCDFIFSILLGVIAYSIIKRNKKQNIYRFNKSVNNDTSKTNIEKICRKCDTVIIEGDFCKNCMSSEFIF